MENDAAVIVRRVNPRDIMVFMSDPREGWRRVRLLHKPTGLEGHGEAPTMDEARAQADAELDAHFTSAGLER